MGEDDKKYRVLRRASELNIKLSGASLPEILSDSGFALFDLLVDLETVEPNESVPIEVEGSDADDLMVNWMRELLYAYQANGYVLKEFTVQQTGEYFVRAEAKGEKYNPDRHEEREAIGAVESRLCHLGQIGNQWTAQAGFAL